MLHFPDLEINTSHSCRSCLLRIFLAALQLLGLYSYIIPFTSVTVFALALVYRSKQMLMFIFDPVIDEHGIIPSGDEEEHDDGASSSTESVTEAIPG